MRFSYEPKKAAQAAAYLIKLHGRDLSMMALIKLLYLADRRALLERGSPITGDKMVCMPHGPVLSRIYDSAKWGNIGDGDPWYEYMSERDNNQIGLVRSDFEPDELSEYETDLLEAIHENYGEKTAWQLRNLTHELPEWRDPEGSSLPLDPTEILRAHGKSDEEIQRIATNAEEDWFLTHLPRLKAAQ